MWTLACLGHPVVVTSPSSPMGFYGFPGFPSSSFWGAFLSRKLSVETASSPAPAKAQRLRWPKHRPPLAEQAPARGGTQRTSALRWANREADA